MNKDDLTKKRAFSIEEAARHACVSRGMIENWLVQGHLPFEELPGSGNGNYRFRRIRRLDLDAFLESRYTSLKTKQKTGRKAGQLLLKDRSR